MKRALWILAMLVPLVSSCSNPNGHSHAVYMLLDTSGTYTQELQKAQAILNYLLATLQPGDSLAVARIDTGSFTEKDIVKKMTFDGRPSMSNRQKLDFRKVVDGFVATAEGSSFTDITGGILQASEFLKETGAGQKTILVFSDMEEELAKGYIRDIPFSLSGIEVVALNVTKLRGDILDPRKYMDRLQAWKKKVESGGGNWRVVNDIERVERILPG
jgi:hypothetical protein